MRGHSVADSEGEREPLTDHVLGATLLLRECRAESGRSDRVQVCRALVVHAPVCPGSRRDRAETGGPGIVLDQSHGAEMDHPYAMHRESRDGTNGAF